MKSNFNYLLTAIACTTPSAWKGEIYLIIHKEYHPSTNSSYFNKQLPEILIVEKAVFFNSIKPLGTL